MNLLLELGADVYKSDDRSFSPIYPTRIPPSLKLLLDHDAEIMRKTGVGATSFGFVSRNRRHDMIEPLVYAHADPNTSDADDTALIGSTYDHQSKSAETLFRLGANPNLAAQIPSLTALHCAVIDNQHDIVQQPLSDHADCTFKAEEDRNTLHLAAPLGGKLTMNTISQARLRGTDPEARRSLGKTAREYFKGRDEGGATDDASATLLDIGSMRNGLRDAAGLLPEVFDDAVEEI